MDVITVVLLVYKVQSVAMVRILSVNECETIFVAA